MIFKPELVELIKQGKKTMTRRPVKPGEKECRYKPNHAYALQPGRGKRGDEKITIVAVRQQRLDDISEKDAKREGFANKQAFVRYWIGLYGHYDPDQLVWVISFVLGNHADVDRYLAASPPKQFCAAVLPNGKRCGRGFSDDPEPQTVCRCGTRRPPETMSEIGYTTVAHRGLRGEPPAIPSGLQEEYSKQAREKPREESDAEIVEQRGRILDAITEIRKRTVDRNIESKLRTIERQAWGLAPEARRAA
jgi:uncharacterized protein YqfB (UPF0267 family)